MHSLNVCVCVCVCRLVEGVGCPYPDDWNTDSSPVVHLRHGQGDIPSAPPTAPGDA